MNYRTSVSDDPLTHIITHLQKPLPFPCSLLQKQYLSLPPELKTPQLHSRLTSKNIELIQFQFQQLIYQVEACFPTQNEKCDFSKILNLINNLLMDYPNNGNLYQSNMQKLSYNKQSDNLVFLKSILENIKVSHCLNFQINPIPEKYSIMILSSIRRYENTQTDQINVQGNADLLRTCLIKINDDNESDTLSQVSEVSSETSSLSQKNSSRTMNYYQKISGFTKKIYHKAVDLFHKSQKSQKEKIQAKTKVFKPGKQVKKIKKIKGQLKKAFTFSLYHQLSFEETQIISHFYKNIVPTTVHDLSNEPYLLQAVEKIDFICEQMKLKQCPKFQHLLEDPKTSLVLIKNSLLSVQNNQSKHNNTESVVIVLMHIFLFLTEKSYDPIKRKILQSIFISFRQTHFYNSNQILRWLESEKFHALYCKEQSSENEIQKQSEQLLNRLHTHRTTFLSQSNLQNIPFLKFIKLSSNLPKRKKVVNIFVSGFLSEDTDKLAQWKDLVDCMPDSQIFAIQWQSDTILNLIKFFMFSCKDLVMAKKIFEELQKKFVQNPFNPAFIQAQSTGRYLAQLLCKLFPHNFLNIYGYSLGTQVIKQFMKRMIEKGSEKMMNKIYLMGGVSDVKELQLIISSSEYPISLYNCYTMHDTVLRYLLSLCQPEITPIGLNSVKQIEGHDITNVDCTNFISGHLSFRRNLDILGKVLQTHKQ